MPLVLIADDHPLFRSALKQAVQQCLPTAEIAEADEISGLQSLLEAQGDADLLLLDLHMPGAHGFSGLIFVQAHYPALPVLVVSAHDAPDIMLRAIEHGAAGFLPKSSGAATIAEALRAALCGDLWLPAGVSTDGSRISDEEQDTAEALASLTPQQFRVATMLAEGLQNKQIAYELNVTEATIKAHMTTILRKLGVRSRTQAVLALARLDVTPPGQDALQR